MAWIDIGLALLTIGLGLFGFLAPRYTLGALDLRQGETAMGLSEMRASVGGLFVAVGAVCLITAAPAAYLMLGVVYAGAGLGRAVSLIVDRPPMPKAAIWFLFEALPAAYLIWAHGGSI